MRLKDTPMLSAVVAISALVAIAGKVHDKPELVWLFMPLTTGVIAWAAWRRGAVAERYAQGIFIGLLLWIIGDVLAVATTSVPAGLFVYVIAHIGFAKALSSRGSWQPGWPLALFFMVANIALIACAYEPGSAVPLLTLGLLALANAVALAIAYDAQRPQRRQTTTPDKLARSAFAGMLLIAVSIAFRIIDTTLLAHAFSATWILASQWAGLTLLALSIRWHPQRTSDSEGVRTGGGI